MIPNGNSDPDKGVLRKIKMGLNAKDAGFLAFKFHLEITDCIEQERNHTVGFISSLRVKQDTVERMGAMEEHHYMVLGAETVEDVKEYCDMFKMGNANPRATYREERCIAVG